MPNLLSSKIQIRLKLSESFALAARGNVNDPILQPLKNIMDIHGLTLSCQLEQFETYLASVKSGAVEGDADTVKLTEETVADPVRRDKYSKVFIVAVKGEELYEPADVQNVLNDLQALAGGPIVEQVQKIPHAIFHPRRG